MAEMHVEVLNYAVGDIPPERMRMHVCWASTGGPHHREEATTFELVVNLKTARPSASPSRARCSSAPTA